MNRARDNEPNWDELAALPGLRGVIDPADLDGAKNQIIDRAHKRAVRRGIGTLHGKRVLDFGCGIGRLSAWLIEHGAEVHGVDASIPMVELAKARAPSGRFDLIDDTEPKLPIAAYDVVLTVGVLQYFAAERKRLTRLLGHLATALAPGGQLVAIEQVNDQGLDRGGSFSLYRGSFEDAGCELVNAIPVRLGHSRILHVAMRHSLLSRVPVLPDLLRWEARLRGAAGNGLEAPRYSEWLFVATRRLGPPS